MDSLQEILFVLNRFEKFDKQNLKFNHNLDPVTIDSLIQEGYIVCCGKNGSGEPLYTVSEKARKDFKL